MDENPPVPPGVGPQGRPPVQYPANPPLAPPYSPAPPGTIRPAGGWGLPPEPDPIPARRVSPWVAIVGVIAVLALVAGILAAFAGGDDDDEVAGGGRDREETTTTTEPAAEDPTPPTAVPEPDPDEPTDFDAVVRDIQDFVAEERGLPFLRDVTVELEEDAAFEARLLADFEEDVPDIVVSGQVLQALGLVEPGTDLVEALRSLYSGGVIGFYDPETDELVVRGSSASPYVRVTIAHELVHALDDQHFELNRPEVDEAPDEQSFGFVSLVEGNAKRIEFAYRATFTAEEEQEYLREELQVGSNADISDVPLVLFESLLAPYTLGPDLVLDILEAGGQERLDSSFSAPPVSSEALLDPASYLEGQVPVPVPAPVADGAEIDRNVLGALGLAQILGEAQFAITGGGGPSEAVLGWGGDGYVAWVDGDRVCLRANLVGDTADDTAEMASALEDWASNPPFDVTATVEVADVVTLTSCG